MNWPRKLAQILVKEPCVVVTLNLILGSAPRESGSRLLVTSGEVFGSIGGGNLEFTAIAEARRLLQSVKQTHQESRPFGLGPKLNQCCGGAVTLNFEWLDSSPDWLTALAIRLEQKDTTVLAMEIESAEPRRQLLEVRQSAAPDVPPAVWQAGKDLLKGVETSPSSPDSANPVVEVKAEMETWWLEVMQDRLQPLILFGAGHVGQEVARLLERLAFEVVWVDSREDVFPQSAGENIHPVCTPMPIEEVKKAPRNSVFVVMTHSHELDEDICYEILKRNDFAWLGLIGSETKRRRFVQRLNKRGINEDQLTRMVCPIGLDGIRGKQPATIALSLVAQLMMEQPWTTANN